MVTTFHEATSRYSLAYLASFIHALITLGIFCLQFPVLIILLLFLVTVIDISILALHMALEVTRCDYIIVITRLTFLNSK